MIKTIQLQLQPVTAASSKELRMHIAKEESIDERTITTVRITKKSYDARHRDVLVNITAEVYINEEAPTQGFENISYPNVEGKPRVVVVGAGPAGLFAALHLIKKNLCPVILERGKEVHERRRDIAKITKDQKVDGESNYSFGEGGAGAFSDGKLYTRSKKRGNVEEVLQTFCYHGADPSILYEAHPHLGTDKLPNIVEHMRKTILKCGGEVHFQTRVTSFLLESEKIIGVETSNGKHFKGKVILATGHSARDIYRYLYAAKIPIEIKGLALGVRLEHKAELIDQLQYHNPNGKGKYLPTAEYRYVTQSEGRGVYSFCMCPGGTVVPAASGSQQIVVNGMSASNRGSRWSNSGMVVEIQPDDLKEESLNQFMVQAMNDETFAENHQDYKEESNPLRMMYLQEALEKSCWQQGNHSQTAPAQRMKDFVEGHLSYDLPETSYSPGLISSPLHFWMPQFITKRLQDGFRQFGKLSRGFLTNDATMIAIESRTSSPVRIIRDRESLQHITLKDLYPCGEGAGYAGGIVSAAVDGIRCADALAKTF